MPYLLDTCSLSEFVANKPNRAVITRLRTLPAPETFIAASSLGEIKQGIDEMKPCRRQDELQEWLYNKLIPRYSDRTISFDKEEALRWGQLQALMRVNGTKMQVEDSLIAAVALAHGLTVVTRNDSDFVHSGVRLYNPWN